ncbi:MAG TPA: hypothetical protein VF613_24715, partial [Longimicrobium sp.]
TIRGNSIISSAAQSQPGISVHQWAGGLKIRNYVQSDTIMGFPTSIVYRNDNSAHIWEITENRHDGLIRAAGNTTGTVTMWGNERVTSGTAPTPPSWPPMY